MKKSIIFSLVVVLSAFTFIQKIDVKVAPMVKNKKMVNVEGLLTINDKPFLLVSESNRMIVDYSAAFYPIDDDMNLGEPIRQENVNLIDGFMALSKCLYIENIILNKGKTILFYSKREGSKATVYYVFLDEDCLIDESAAIEVMDLEVGAVSKNTNFTVRQSPDQSKILVVGMNDKKNKSSDYFFKVYNSDMSNLIWEKNVDAPRLTTYFKGSDNFNTGKNTNSRYQNNFLVNNEGRAYFLVDKENPSGIKHELGFLSIDPVSKLVNEKEIQFRSEFYGETIFRLNKNGEANFIVFYSTVKLKVEMSNMWGSKITSLHVLSYDGKDSKVLRNIQFSEDDQSLFYPASKRKAKTEYRIGGYYISGAIDLPNNDLAIVMEQSFSTVGTERPASNQGNGYVNVLLLDSGFQVKSCYPFIRFSSTRGYRNFASSQVFFRNNQLELLFCNEEEELQWVNLSDKLSKPMNLKAKYTEKCNAYCSEAILLDGAYILPLIGNKTVGCSSLK